MPASESPEILWMPLWLRVWNWLCRDALVICLYGAATLVMTYPLIRNMGRGAFPDHIDALMKLWDIWWFGRIIQGYDTPFQTDLLFHPNGLDMHQHSISWTMAGLGWLISRVVGGIDIAYKFTVLIEILTTLYSGYLLIHHLIGDRNAAWVGGAIYGFAPYYMWHTLGHPDVAALAPLPLTLLLLWMAYESRQLRHAIGAGLMVGLAALTSLYILGYLVITLAVVWPFLLLQDSAWREKWAWHVAIAFGLSALITTGLRLIPFLAGQDTSGFINETYRADTEQTDLLALIIPPQTNPIFTPLVGKVSANFGKNMWASPYIGLVPVSLGLFAVIAGRNRKMLQVWWVMALVFLILSLGPVLRINGQIYHNIRLPFFYLEWLPVIKAFRPHFLMIGFFLPLGVCAADGLRELNDRLRVPSVIGLGLASLLAGGILFEYWIGPYPVRALAISPFYEALAHEEGEFAVIQLPIRYMQSKAALYYQIAHGRPIVAGYRARLPDNSYGYLRQNLLLTLWLDKTDLDCTAYAEGDMKVAVEALRRDGFRYVIIDDPATHPRYLAYFAGVSPTYQDEYVTVYQIDDLVEHPPCSASR